MYFLVECDDLKTNVVKNRLHHEKHIETVKEIETDMGKKIITKLKEKTGD